MLVRVERWTRATHPITRPNADQLSCHASGLSEANRTYSYWMQHRLLNMPCWSTLFGHFSSRLMSPATNVGLLLLCKKFFTEGYIDCWAQSLAVQMTESHHSHGSPNSITSVPSTQFKPLFFIRYRTRNFTNRGLPFNRNVEIELSVKPIISKKN